MSSEGFTDDFSDDFPEDSLVDDFSDEDFDSNRFDSNDGFTSSGFADDDFTDDFDDGFGEEPPEKSPVVFNPSKISDSVTAISLSAEDLATGIFAETEKKEEDEDLADFKVLEEELLNNGYEDLADEDFDVLNQLAERQKLIDSKKENPAKYLLVFNEKFKSLHDDLSTSIATLEGSTGENAEYLRDNVSAETDNPVYLAAEKIAASIIAVKKARSGSQEPVVTADEIFQYMLSRNENILDTDEENLKEYLHQIIPKIIAYNKSVGKCEENNKLARNYSADILLRKPKALLQSMAGNLDSFSFIKNIWADNGRYWVKCEKCGKETELHNVPVLLVRFASAKTNITDSTGSGFLHLPVKCGCGAYMILTSKEYAEVDKAVLENYKLPNAATSRSSILASAMQQVTQLCSGAASLVIEPPVTEIIEAVPYLVRERRTANEATDKMQAVQEPGLRTAVKFDSAEFLEAVSRFKDRLKTFKQKPDRIGSGSVGNAGFAGNGTDSDGIVNAVDVWDKRALPERTIVAVILNALSKSYAEEKSKALFSFIYHVQENPVLNECLDYAEIIDLEQTLLLLNGLTEQTIPYIEPDRKANLVALWSYTNTVYGLDYNYNKSDEEKILELLDNSVYIVKTLGGRTARRKAALDFMNFYKEAFGYFKIINVSSVKASDFDRYICDEETWKLADEISDLMLINNYAEEYYEVWKSYGVLDHGHLDDLLRKKTGKAGILNSIESRLKVFFKANGVNCKVPNGLSVIVAPVSSLHEVVRKCCIQVQNLNYYRFLKCAEELPEDLEYVIPNDLSAEYESARKRLVLLAAEELAGRKEYEYYLRDFSQQELKEYSDELELFTFGRWVLKRREGEKLSDYIARFGQSEEGKYDYVHSDDCLGKFMHNFNDVLVLMAVAAFSSIEYQSYNTSVFIVQTIRAVSRAGSRELLQKFLNVSDAVLNSVENCTAFADGNYMELDLCKDFYRILNGNYFTSASDVVNTYCKKAEKEMLSIYENIGTKASNRKKEMLAAMAGEIEALSEQPADSNVSGYEEMADEILEKVNGKAARKVMGFM